MIPKEIRSMPNPYFTLTSKLQTHQFIGREDETSKLKYILEDYAKTTNLRNLIITGDKSIGKSTLLNRYKQIFQDHSFVVSQ